MNTTTQTLAQRLASGRMAVSEGLPIAMQLAQELRQWHERESVHGALTPSTVGLADGAVQLLGPEAAESKWAYEAPEVKLGSAADGRSDIFSFGAIVFEMLTGERIFIEGLALGLALQTGHAGVDRLVNGCVAHAPERRFQQMEKVILELRLLAAAGKRWSAVLTAAPQARVEPGEIALAEPTAQDAPVATPPLPVVETPAAQPVQSLHDLEGRISARLQEQERSIATVAQVATEVLKALREQQGVAATAVARRDAAPQPVAATPEPPATRGMGFRAYDDLGGMGSRTDKMLDLLSDKLSRLDLVVTSMADRMQKLEDVFDQFDSDAAALRDSVTRDVRNFERVLKSQGAAIESARTAMGQTDDLVERVVEALDSLQAMFVTSAEEQTLAS